MEQYSTGILKYTQIQEESMLWIRYVYQLHIITHYE